MKKTILTYLLLLILPATSIASDLTDFTGGGGDFSDGGEPAGADRTIGNNDNFDLGFITNDIERLHIQNDGNIGIGTETDLGTGNLNVTIESVLIPALEFSRKSDALNNQAIGRIASYAGSGTQNEVARIEFFTSGTTEDAGEISFYTSTGGSLSPAIRIDRNGDIGINETNPDAKLEINGTLHVIGKTTHTGGTDPPYVLYDLETRQSTIDRIKKEVPKSKLGGATMFFNSATNMMEIFVATTGKFFDMMGTELATVTPITDTYPVKTKHYFTDDGTVITMEVPDKNDITSPVQYRIKNNYEMDRWSGKFYSMKKDANGNDIRDIEVTKNNAIEVK